MRSAGWKQRALSSIPADLSTHTLHYSSSLYTYGRILFSSFHHQLRKMTPPFPYPNILNPVFKPTYPTTSPSSTTIILNWHVIHSPITWYQASNPGISSLPYFLPGTRTHHLDPYLYTYLASRVIIPLTYTIVCVCFNLKTNKRFIIYYY